MLRVIDNAFLLVHGKNRVKEWVPFLKQCCVVEMIANLPCFFEAIFAGMGETR